MKRKIPESKRVALALHNKERADSKEHKAEHGTP